MVYPARSNSILTMLNVPAFNPLLAGFYAGLKPEKKISVAEWAEQNIILPEMSAEPGPYRVGRTPYARKIMEALSPSSKYRKIIFMKSSQVGGTQIGLNWIGSIIANAPGGILLVSPTDSNAKRNSKIRIEPMIKGTPELRKRIQSSKIRDSGNTVLQKDFTGGFLVMVGSNSTADVKSLPCRYIDFDEIDEYAENLEGQGSVLELGEVRTQTFRNSKIYMNSTPTMEGRSNIEREFLETDQCYYFVPCPCCKHKQRLEFEQLVWNEGNYQDVFYKCIDCGHLMVEADKTWMLDDERAEDPAEWRATCLHNVSTEKIGFHINALYSPWYKWAKICEKYDKALNNEPKMIVFNNTILGKTHKHTGEQPDYNILFQKRVSTYQPNKPPAEVCFITAGADVQKDRIEVEIVGWGKGKRSWSIDYRVLYGETNQLAVFNALTAVVHESWTRADGVILPLKLLCIDSGHNQSYVYDFCRRFDMSRVVPVKGGPPTQGIIVAQPRIVDYMKDGKKVGDVRSWNVAVSMLKSEFYGWLKLNPDQTDSQKPVYPPGFCFFPQDGRYSDINHFRGICSEQLEGKTERGTIKYTWVKKYPFNEPLDCRNYARAAAYLLGIDRFEDQHYDAMAGQYARKPVKKSQGPREDDWI
jgi:phage terminase large subunit GpA-like protein